MYHDLVPDRISVEDLNPASHVRFSLLSSKEAITKDDVEQYLDGNICRCTGYRPILDAFKTFGEDADQKTNDMVKDIEVRRKGAVV